MQDIETFRKPKVDLEQYPTYPHIAARMLYTGMLAIGAALMGSPHVIAVDIDEDALQIAQENVQKIDEDLPVELLLCDVRHLTAQARLRVPVVITNPPFGTKRKGADMEFLRIACQVATQAVYSLHKTSTRAHIQRVAERELGVTSAEVLAQLKYDLPATMKFHKEKSLDIEVDLWRFELRGAEGDE